MKSRRPKELLLSSRAMVSKVCRVAIVACVLGASAIACQNYDFAFQPLQDRQGIHLRFEVQTPSRADLVFLVDNSSSMTEEQAALTRSIDALIDEFAGTDTSYRVAVVSTDGVGFTVDCDGNTNPPESATNTDNHGARGELACAPTSRLAPAARRYAGADIVGL